MSAWTSGLVGEVHPLERSGRIRRAVRDHHHVEPEVAALVGPPPLDVVAADQVAVAGPADRGDHVAARQVLGVLVAGEACRIWPESTAAPILSIAASQSSLVASAMSTPVAPHHHRDGVAHLVEHVTRPLYLGSKRSLTEVTSSASLGVDPDAGHPALPRDRELVLGVVGALGLELRREVVERRRDVVRVDLLEVAEVVHLLRHPVGDDDDVAAARIRPRRAAAASCRRTGGCR